MGTHSYTVMLIKRKENFPVPEEMSFSSSLETYGFGFRKFSSQSREEVVWSYGCREVMHRYMAEYLSRELITNFKTLMGVRMSGEQYSAVIKILAQNQNENLSKLSAFLANLTGISLRIDLETERINSRFTYRKSDSHAQLEKLCVGDIRVYVPLWENEKAVRINTKLCVIGALLKEPRVVSKILSGEIHDVESLVVELLHIARDRANKTDTSYECYSLVGSYGKTHEQIMNQILDVLAYDANLDGSSWLDITKLAVYIYYMTSRKLTNLFTGGQVGGPSDCATYHVRFPTYVEMFKNIPDKEVLEFLGRKRSGGSNMRKAWVNNA